MRSGKRYELPQLIALPRPHSYIPGRLARFHTEKRPQGVYQSEQTIDLFMKKRDQTTLIDTAPEKVGEGPVAPDIALVRSMPGVTLRTAQYAIPRSRLRTDKKENLVTSRLTRVTTRTLTALVRL